MGTLSHILRNCTHGGKFVAFWLHFILEHTFISPAPSPPVYRMDGLSTRDRTYFLKLRAHVFWVRWRWYTIIINVYMWFIVCLGHLYFVWRFGTAGCRTSRNSWWRRFSRQHVIIFYLIFSNGLRFYLTLLKSQKELIGHLYDIKIFV